MTTSWKPEGHPVVSPYLVTPRAAAVIEFVEQVFGGTQLTRIERPDGSIIHAEVRVADSVVMLGEAHGEWEPVPTNLHVYVDDVDAVYERALKAGAVAVQPPARKDDADRRGGVMDAGGNTWWIATRVE